MVLLILLADYKTHWFAPVHSWLLGISRPVYSVADVPSQTISWFKQRFSSRDDLQLENARLRTENLVLHAKVQKLNALTIENIRLRELLNSTRTSEENAIVAEIISVSPDPFNHFVVVNKGSKDGVFLSQTIVDAQGLFGQVVEVSESTSRVMLVSDPRHGVPVQIDRNGVRLIAEGTGDYLRLQLPFVTVTTDIVPGDVLSTSGLGGVFPANYPVARVIEVKHDPGQAFADVLAEPYAQLSRTRHVLLLFNRQTGNEN